MGKGRASAQDVIARRAGNIELADKLAPPSLQKLMPEERCGARTQGTGKPCRKMKGSATDHPGYGNCVNHGGNTPEGRKSAMREMGRDILITYKTRFGGDRTDPTIASLTPEQALLEEVRRSAAMVRFLEERIARWNLTSVEEATLNTFLTKKPKLGYTTPLQKREVEQFLDSLDPASTDSPQYLPPLTSTHDRTGITSSTDAKEWLFLYREERMHLARVAKMALDAGVAQRLVTIAEDQGRILASALRIVLQALGLSPEQQALVPHIVPQVLRAVATDSPIPDISSLALPSPATSEKAVGA